MSARLGASSPRSLGQPRLGALGVQRARESSQQLGPRRRARRLCDRAFRGLRRDRPARSRRDRRAGDRRGSDRTPRALRLRRAAAAGARARRSRRRPRASPRTDGPARGRARSRRRCVRPCAREQPLRATRRHLAPRREDAPTRGRGVGRLGKRRLGRDSPGPGEDRPRVAGGIAAVPASVRTPLLRRACGAARGVVSVWTTTADAVGREIAHAVAAVTVAVATATTTILLDTTFFTTTTGPESRGGRHRTADHAIDPRRVVGSCARIDPQIVGEDRLRGSSRAWISRHLALEELAQRRIGLQRWASAAWPGECGFGSC